MFMWKYFFLYVFIGFLSGFSNPFENQNRGAMGRRPIEGFFGIIVLIAIGLVIWNFFVFGASWGALSILEFALGYFFGRTLARRNF